MLRSLLAGAGETATLWELARALQLPRSGTFVVLSAEIRPHSDPNAADELERALRAHDVQSMWLTELDTRTGLLSCDTSAAAEHLPDIVRAVPLGRIGLSRPFRTPIESSSARRAAELACRCVVPGTDAVNTYGDSAVGLLIAHAPQAGRELAHHVLGPVLALPDPAERDTLLHTLATWFECGGSSTRVAARLHYHRNTVHHRLRRVHELTGRSCTDPKQASELYVAVRATALLAVDQSAATTH